MLVNEVRLCVFPGGLCSLRIGFTQVPKNIEGLAILGCNRLFVVVQSPRQILGLTGKNEIFLTPNEHSRPDLIFIMGPIQ